MLVFAKTACTVSLGGFPVDFDSVSCHASKSLPADRTLSLAVRFSLDCVIMAKTHRKLKKSNHGQRPANSKARRLKRKHVKLS
jgi:hypothetical protein